MNRLHPSKLVVRVVSLAALGFQFPIFLTAMVGLAVGFEDAVVLLDLMFVLPFVGAGYAVLEYLLFRYGVDGDRFNVESGVVFRRSRQIPLDRIQTVRTRQSFLKRLLGMETVTIQTAGGNRAEATLDHVSEAEAERLRDVLRPEDRSADDPETSSEDRRRLLFDLAHRRLALLTVTTFVPGAALLLVLVNFYPGELVQPLLAVARPLGGPERLALRGTSVREAAVGLAVLSPVALVAMWLISAVLLVNRYYRHRLARTDEALLYERGLASRATGDVPFDRIQTVTVQETLPMRLFGYASVVVKTAGGRTNDGTRTNLESARVVPIASLRGCWGFVDGLLDHDDVTLTRPPRRARRRYTARYALGLAGLAVLGFVLSSGRSGLWIVPLVGLPVAPVAAHLKWRNLGYDVQDRCVVIRRGFWVRTTTLVPHDRLQTVAVRRSPFQRRWRLADLVVDTASSTGFFGSQPTAVDVDAGTAGDLHRRVRDRFRHAVRSGDEVVPGDLVGR